MKFTLIQYVQYGCYYLTGLSTTPDRLDKIYNDADGQLCNRNCNFYNDGSCQVYKNLLTILPASAKNVVFSNSVKDEAKRLGISISEVRRRRTLLRS